MNTIDFYGADWCPDCQRAKAYLKENGIDFNFIDVDIDKNGQQNWSKKPITENALSQQFSSTKNPIQIQIMLS